jgi:hypothetical protein
MLSTYGFFYLPHLLWHRSSVFKVIPVSKRPEILTSKSSEGSITTYFKILSLTRQARAGHELTTTWLRYKSSTTEPPDRSRAERRTVNSQSLWRHGLLQHMMQGMLTSQINQSNWVLQLKSNYSRKNIADILGVRNKEKGDEANYKKIWRHLQDKCKVFSETDFFLCECFICLCTNFTKYSVKVVFNLLFSGIKFIWSCRLGKFELRSWHI